MRINFEVIRISPIQSEHVDYKTLIFKLDVGEKINIDNSKDLSVFLKTIIDGGVLKVIIDLKELEYIDSSGIGVLINSTKLIRTNSGDIVLSSVPPEIKNIFRTINLQNFIKLYNFEAEAINSFRFV